MIPANSELATGRRQAGDHGLASPTHYLLALLPALWIAFHGGWIVHRASAQDATFRILSDSSFIEIIEGVPNSDADAGFVVVEGTRFAKTVAVIEQAPGSLRTALAGELHATVVGQTISFSGGSILDALENPGPPFLPGSQLGNEGTGSLATEDNFGALGAFIRPENVLATLAVRDAAADIISGSASIDGSVQDLQFAITSGVFDVALDVPETFGFFNLATLLVPVRNQSQEPLIGSLDGTITIPFALDFELGIFSEGDSRLILTGQIVAQREQLVIGDYNANGFVEQGDLDLVLLNWGANEAQVPTEWREQRPSGRVDQEELDAVLLNWGSQNARAVIGAIVPEPSGSFILAVSGVLFCTTFLGNRRRCSTKSSPFAHTAARSPGCGTTLPRARST